MIINLQEEEEWKDYEEPVKDYTGLKIQVLQGGAGAPESGRDPATEDCAPENTKNKGPWNKPVWFTFKLYSIYIPLLCLCMSIEILVLNIFFVEIHKDTHNLIYYYFYMVLNL